ncbi:MAG: Ig-like domain-containing protein, partial [Terriglobales bacterium]
APAQRRDLLVNPAFDLLLHGGLQELPGFRIGQQRLHLGIVQFRFLCILWLILAGTVTFNNGTTPLGKGMLSAGKVRFTTSALAEGTSSITAVYRGSTDFTASKSPVLKQTVN